MKVNVLWGYGSEDIISKYAKEFESESSKVCLVNPREHIKDIENLAGINIITSNHFTRTISDLKELYPEYEINHDFYDYINKIRVNNLIFMYHDHLHLNVLDEEVSLQNFTAVVTPWPSLHKNSRNIKLFCCDMAFKNKNEYERTEIKRKAIWFVSNIKHGVDKYGIENFALKIAKMIEDLDIPIKLPEYGLIGLSLENELIKNGIEVIPASYSTEKLMLESEIIIASSYSGVTAQGFYYNKNNIVICNDDHPEGNNALIKYYNSYYKFIPNLKIVVSNEQLKIEINKHIGKSSKIAKHICGIFRDDFFEFYSELLF